MKRSGDVTASAIILFCGSGIILLLAAFAGLAGALNPPANEPRAAFLAGEFMVIAMYVVLAGWGIATGIGILKLQPWARISMIVMSALAVFGCLCAGAGFALMPALLKGNPDPQVPPNFIVLMVVVFIGMLLIPLGIAIWWLILFTRKRVALEFASRGASITSPPVALENRPAIAQSSPIAPIRPGVPLSIRIITIFYIVGAAMIFVTLEFTFLRDMPTLLLGFVIQGWAERIFLIALGLIQLVICIAVLRKRAWVLDALIAILVFGAVNTLGFLFSPSRNEVFARVMQNQGFPDGIAQQSMKEFMGLIMPISIVSGVIFGVVMLYFLITRRKAFRAACAKGSGE